MSALNPALHTLGVAALSRALARKQVSSVELTTALQARLAQHQGLGAFLATNAEGALAEARAADAAIAAGTAGPLAGVPLAHKDIFVTDFARTGLPTTAGQTITNLAGFPTGTPTASSPYAFFFADLSPSVPGVDTVYVADDGVGGGVQKYSLNAGAWTLKGVVGADADDFRGLTGVVNGGSVSLFATGGGNRLVSLTDSSGYDGTFASSVTTLATAGTNTAFRGVALLPVPEPGTWALMLGGLALVAGLARRARG